MRYFRGLTISLTIHLLLALGISQIEPLRRSSSTPLSIVELWESPELARRPKQRAFDEKQFVRKTEIPPEMKTEEEREKRFASEDNVNVIEEQRAKESGMTTNRAENQPSLTPSFSRDQNLAQNGPNGKRLDFSPDSALEKGRKDLLEDNSPGAPRVGAIQNRKRDQETSQTETQTLDGSKRLTPPDFVPKERGLSTLGEKLPDDIRLGEMTVLNTDRHLFYTFFARMEEKIRHRWESYARAAIFNLDAEGKRRARDRGTWTTRLEIVLDREGRFIKAVLEDSSGSRSLDSAPVQAFRDAQQFPNPPVEMIKNSGEIRIQYAFTVQMVPSFAAGP